jgi:hypothetical protein
VPGGTGGADLLEHLLEEVSHAACKKLVHEYP